MMNKKGSGDEGVKIVGGHTIEIIVAVLCILVLIALGVKLFLSWDNGYQEILKKIDQKINYLKSPSYTQDFLYVTVYLPKKSSDLSLYLKSYEEGFFPEKECVGIYESCLCMCDKPDCSGAKTCKGIKDKVIINNVLGVSVTIVGKNYDVLGNVESSCSCRFDGLNPVSCSGDCDCVRASSADSSDLIYQKMSRCFSSFNRQNSDLGGQLGFIPISSLGVELKIEKKGEVIEISKSDR